MTLHQSDFDCVGLVAVHCDHKKLCIAIDEARLFDLRPLLCEYFERAIGVVDEVDAYLACLADGSQPDCVEPENYEQKYSFVYGGEYSGGCTSGSHLGIKRVWTYFAYSRYLIINGFNDTPSGVVRKTNEFSIPTPLAEVKSYADKYRSMGNIAFADLTAFICANRSVFPESCACRKCGRGTQAKGYGNKGRIIRKYDL